MRQPIVWLLAPLFIAVACIATRPSQNVGLPVGSPAAFTAITDPTGASIAGLTESGTSWALNVNTVNPSTITLAADTGISVTSSPIVYVQDAGPATGNTGGSVPSQATLIGGTTDSGTLAAPGIVIAGQSAGPLNPALVVGLSPNSNTVSIPQAVTVLIADAGQLGVTTNGLSWIVDAGPSVGNTGGAVPGQATYVCGNQGGNCVGLPAGNSTAPMRTDPTGTTTQPVSGTVTANIGTAPTLNTTNPSVGPVDASSPLQATLIGWMTDGGFMFAPSAQYPFPTQNIGGTTINSGSVTANGPTWTLQSYTGVSPTFVIKSSAGSLGLLCCHSTDTTEPVFVQVWNQTTARTNTDAASPSIIGPIAKATAGQSPPGWCFDVLSANALSPTGAIPFSTGISVLFSTYEGYAYGADAGVYSCDYGLFQ